MTRLSDLTTLRLGGPARQIASCYDEKTLLGVVTEADEAGDALLVLAGGSNVVVADAGFPGTVVRVLTEGLEQQDRGDHVLFRVQAGETWDRFVERTVCEGLAGIEALSGIPGSVGATPIQNVGAYGQEVRDTVIGVRAYDRQSRQIRELTPEACGFGYRSSVFKRNPDRWLVLNVTFALARAGASTPILYAELARALGVEVGDSAPPAAVRSAVLTLRRGKGMVIDPGDPDTTSAGSFFLNPILDPDELKRLQELARETFGPEVRVPVFPERDGRVKVSAAWLIERAGFRRGYGNPVGIALSNKHALALTNRGEGTTEELVRLAAEIVERVQRMLGVRLNPEPVLVGCTWPEV